LVGREIRSKGGRSEAINLLRRSESPDARRFLEVYDDAPASSRALIPLEDFCPAADVTTRRLLEIIVGEAYETNTLIAAAIAFMDAPEMVRRTIELSKRRDALGLRAQEVMHEMTGAMPTPKGAQTMLT
jgi:hypothetical protein